MRRCGLGPGIISHDRLRRTIRRTCLLSLIALLAPSCLPYAVTSTAHTARPGEVEPTGIVYGVPTGREVLREEEVEGSPIPLVGFDVEARIGVDERSDIGVRVFPYGVVGSYKRRVVGAPDGSTPAFAITGGLGFVNAFDYLHFEATLTGSARQGTFTPYGGLRIMQVAPIGPAAVSDSPTMGGFVGVRVGGQRLAIVPEIGWYWDESALDVRSDDQIVVWAVGLQGQALLGALEAIARRVPLFR